MSDRARAIKVTLTEHNLRLELRRTAIQAFYLEGHDIKLLNLTFFNAHYKECHWESLRCYIYYNESRMQDDRNWR